MRPMAAGAAEVWFRGIYHTRLRPVLRQGARHDTRAAADVQDAVAPPDADKLQEGARQATAPSPHEVFVDIRIGRLEWEDKGAHRKTSIARKHKKRSTAKRQKSPMFPMGKVTGRK